MKTNWLDKALANIEKDSRERIATQLKVSAITFNSNGHVEPADKLQRAQAIGKLIGSAAENLLIAGRIVAGLLDESMDNMELILRENPSLDCKFIIRLERIGRGHLEPELALLGDSVIETRMSSLPKEIRHDLLTHKLPVAKKNGDVEHKSIAEMTPGERRQVISAEGLRPVEQQLPKKEKAHKDRWFFNGNSVVFTTLGPFNLKEIETIYETLKRNELGNLNGSMKKNQIA